MALAREHRGAGLAPPAVATAADLYFPGNAGHHHPSPQQLARPRDRAPAGAPEPRRRRRGPAALAPHARPRLSPRQGAAADARAHARPGRRPRRGRRAPGRRCLPRGARRAVDPAADERERRDRPGRGGQAGHLQGDGPGPPGGRARRLQELQLQARDRGHRRRPGRPGHRRAARPARDAGGGRGSWREGRRLRGDRVPGIARRRAVRGRFLRPDAPDHRPGTPHPGLREPPDRARAGRLHGVRHHVPRRLSRGVAPGPAGPLCRSAQGAAREDPAAARRRLRGSVGRLRGPRRAPGRRPAAPRTQCPRPGAAPVRRPDHRVRDRECHASSSPRC